jgi:hypothetical protein
MNHKLPTFITKFFWGDNLNELSWRKHKKYILQTILEKGDQQATKWLLGKEGEKGIKTKLSTLKLSRKSRNFWEAYLS